MRIVKMDANDKHQTMEKMVIPADSVLFVLYDPHHKPVIQVFKEVNEVQIHKRPAAIPEAV